MSKIDTDQSPEARAERVSGALRMFSAWRLAKGARVMKMANQKLLSDAGL